MDPTEQEISWAIAIRDAASKDPDIDASSVTDLEFLQHAIVAKDKVDNAIHRIKRVQSFKTRHGIKLDGSYEEGMRDLKKYLDMFPGFFLSVAGLPDHTHVLCANFSKFYKKALKATGEEGWFVLIRGFFYLLQACQPNVASMRSGLVYMADVQNAGFANFSLRVEERVASVYSNAYPIRITKMAVLNAPFIACLFFRLWRFFVSPKIMQTFDFAGNRDAYLTEKWHDVTASDEKRAYNKDSSFAGKSSPETTTTKSTGGPFAPQVLPAEWGGDLELESLYTTLGQKLKERYNWAAIFKLPGKNDENS